MLQRDDEVIDIDIEEAYETTKLSIGWLRAIKIAYILTTNHGSRPMNHQYNNIVYKALEYLYIYDNKNTIISLNAVDLC
jgi:hypothetical protein